MSPKIKVLGVGGSGSNTVARIARAKVEGIELIAINTDAQALHGCKVEKKILIGKQVTRGLGAGMDAALGRAAAEESRQELEETIKGCDMIFVTCGLGGGTGSGAAPFLASLAKGMGVLTVAAVTTPFSFEGEQRLDVAKKALGELRGNVDSLLVISNDKLLKVIDEKTTVSHAFQMCDDVLRQAVQGVTDVILAPGIINIDFASVISVMKDSGEALFGMGVAKGEGRAVEAAKKAIYSPLLDFSIKGSKGILFNASGLDVTLQEIQDAAKVITENADEKAQIIFGAVKDATLKKGEIKITVIATNIA